MHFLLVANLLREAAAPDGIHLVGDVMYDAALFYEGLAAPSPLVSGILDDNRAGFCLATVHRAENTDDPDRLAGIVSALDAVAGECPVVLPLHPRTRKQLSAHGIAPRRVRVIEPVGYFEMISLLKGCKVVFTDSDGLQKEAYFFRRPCVTMRSETEWVELVSLGVNFIAGTTPAGILAAWESVKRGRFDWSATPNGDGRAGERIVEILLAEAGPAASGAA